MLDFISDTEYFTMVLDLAAKAKETLWILARLTLKNLLLTIALMLATVSIRAQKISHIETTKSWYYVYDDNGKKIKTISTSAGELRGYSANF